MVTVRRLSTILLLAVSYYLTARFSAFLAIPPGFASPVWIPAGVALGMLIVQGLWCWPGVLLGSLALNWEITLQALDGDSTLWVPVINGLVMGLGASLQAALGAWYFRLTFNNNARLEHSKEAIVLIGICLASAVCNTIIGTSSLLVFGLIELKIVLSTAFNWWIGDAIGMLGFASVVMLWGHDNDTITLKRKLQVTFPVLFLFVALVAGFIKLQDIEYHQQRTTYTLFTNSLAVDVEQKIKNASHSLISLQALYYASSQVTRDEFGIFANWELTTESSIQALEWIPVVMHSERELLEEEARAVFPNFAFKEKGESGMQPAAMRSIYYPVYFVEPLRGNEGAVGFDLGSNSARLAAINSAIQSGEFIASDPIKLIQTAGKDTGVLLFKAIYQKGMPTDTLEQRRQAVKGLVLLVLNATDMISKVIETQRSDYVDFYVVDDVTTSLVYGSNKEDSRIFNSESYNVQGRNGKIFNHKTLHIGDKTWEILFYLNEDKIPFSWNTWVFLVIGMAFVSLLGTFLLTATSRIGYIFDLVAEKTKELNITNNKLRIANEKSLAAVESKSKFLSNMSHEIRTPLTAIMGYADIINSENMPHHEPDRCMKMNQRIIHNGSHLLSLINDI